MSSLVVKKFFLMLFFVLSSHLLIAQQPGIVAKQVAHPIHFASHEQSVVTSSAALQLDATSEELLEMYPEAIKYEKRFYPAGKNNYRTKTVKVVDHAKLSAALARSVKKQQAEIQQLRSEVSSIKTK